MSSPMYLTRRQEVSADGRKGAMVLRLDVAGLKVEDGGSVRLEELVAAVELLMFRLDGVGAFNHLQEVCLPLVCLPSTRYQSLTLLPGV